MAAGNRGFLALRETRTPCIQNRKAERAESPEVIDGMARRAEAVRRRMRAYAGKLSHKIILPLLAERGEGRGEEPKNPVLCVV